MKHQLIQSDTGDLVCTEVHERLCLDWSSPNGLVASLGAHLFSAEGFEVSLGLADQPKMIKV